MLLKTENYTDKTGVERIKEFYGKVIDGVEAITGTHDRPVIVETEPTKTEPTQLDRIEAAISKSQEEIANEAVDAYTLELIEGGVL